MNKIYIALYTPCIYESDFTPISVHKTKKGAELAIDKHKRKLSDEFDKLWSDTKDEMNEFKYDDLCDWKIGEYELLE